MLLNTYCVWQATDNAQRLLRHQKITNSIYLRKQDNQSSCAINLIRLCLWTWRGRCKNHTLSFTTASAEKTHSYSHWRYWHLSNWHQCNCVKAWQQVFWSIGRYSVNVLAGYDTASYPFGKGKVSAVNLLLKFYLDLKVVTDS